MKVIEVITDKNVGGAGVLLINRLRCTDTERYDIEVLLPRGSLLCERLNDLGIKFCEIDCTGDRSFEMLSVLRYINIFRRIRPAVVNCHGALSARIAAWICRVPVKICTRHCVFPVRKKERMLSLFNSALSDRFIAVAYAAKENLVSMGIRPRKINVIINGCCPLRITSSIERDALRRTLGIGREEHVLVLCARLEPCKGHLWFFNSVKMLCDDGIRIKILLLGRGSYEKELRHACEKLKISDRVLFIGFVDDTSPYVNIADININCSVGTETSSLALSEGMSIGLPSVVSDYGGNPYMVEHGKNGYVCGCGDSRQMAEYIKKILSDREGYVRMSQEARRRFDAELNAKCMTEKTNKLYDSLYQEYVAEHDR